jgi:hypothetical protein
VKVRSAAIPCAALLALAALLCIAAAAQAATVTDRPLLRTCDGAGATAGPYQTVRDLEVEQATGDLYVYDYGHWVIDKSNAACEARDFAASGESSLPAPWPGTTGTPSLAIDNSGVNPGRLMAARGDGVTSLLSAFAPSGTLLWQLGGFVVPCALAVDPEGHLWVMNDFAGPTSALEFAAAGSPPAQIDEFPYTNAGIQPCSLDFDAAGNAYITAQNGGGGVFKYAKNGEGKYVYESTLDPEESNGVAVDRATGHVFVSHGESFNEYDAAGNPVGAGSFGAGVISAGQGIAVNESGAGGVPAGTVYVANFTGPKVYAFGPEATGTVPDVEAEPVSGIEVSRAVLRGKVDPNGVANSYFFEWKPGPRYEHWGEAKSSVPQSIEPPDAEEHEVSLAVDQLAGNMTYQVRLVGVNTENGLRDVSAPVTFTTAKPAGPPAMTIDPVQAAPAPPCTTGITTEGACVSGTVNPREDFSTTWWLEKSKVEETEEGPECGPFPELWTKSEVKSVWHQLESEADNPLAVHEDLSGLFPSQAYCVRIDAENSFKPSKPTISAIERFETEPVPPDDVTTAFAAPRTTTTARLNAYANPEGEVLSYRFDYKEAGGKNWIPLPEQEDTSEAREPILLAAELGGLVSATEYSFRFVARNHCHPNTEPEAWCTVEGETKTFTTRTQAEAEEVDPPACPNSEVRQNRHFAYLPQCRGIELVNNPDDGNQNVKAEGPQGTPPLSPDGERALWNLNGGAPGANQGVAATFLARRTGPSAAAPNGWSSCSLVPPAAQQIHGEDGSYVLLATTPGLDRFLFLPGEGSLFTETLVRLGECGREQEALRSYDGPQPTSDSDLNPDGAHVLHIDYDLEAAHPAADQLEDIGRPGKAEVISCLPGQPGECALPECGVEDEGGGFSGEGTKGAGLQWRPGYKRMGADASRVYFQVRPNGSNCSNSTEPWLLLERDREANGGAGETLEVAPPDPLNTLIRATADGRSAYFVSELALDPAYPDAEGVNAYRWEEAAETDTCLTCAMENEAGEAIAGADLRVVGGAPAPVLVSDDFSHIYFESTAKLSPQANAGGANNLYALNLAEGKLHFVATPGGEPALGRGNAELSEDGEALVFKTPSGGRPELSADRLAASCPEPISGSPGPCTELFRYEDTDRSLECISCLHGGTTTASVGARDASANDFRMAADGQTVAFVSAEALTPADINGGPDLYEWHSGEQRLITDGEGDFGQGATAALQPYALSASGRDILFGALAPGLTGFETTRLANLYDARIGGGFEVPPPPEGCAEESCQGIVDPPPPFGQPGSAGFEGAGNPSAARSCSAPARRAARLARAARRLRRRAAGLGNHRRAKLLRRRAQRRAQRAQRLARQAKRCRRAA